MDAGPRCAPAPSVTGKRPAKSLSLSTSLPWASGMLKACTSCRLGPRVGVSATRYAFKLPRSVTITRELGVIGKSLAARDRAHLYYLYKEIGRRCNLALARNCGGKTTSALAPAHCSLFLCTDTGKLDAPFFPGFLARLRLRTADQLKETTGAPADIDIITGGEFLRLGQKTARLVRVEDQLPFQMFLTGQYKRDRFVMRIYQQKKRVVADCFTFEIDHIGGIVA